MCFNNLQTNLQISSCIKSDFHRFDATSNGQQAQCNLTDNLSTCITTLTHLTRYISFIFHDKNVTGDKQFAGASRICFNFFYSEFSVGVIKRKSRLLAQNYWLGEILFMAWSFTRHLQEPTILDKNLGGIALANDWSV